MAARLVTCAFCGKVVVQDEAGRLVRHSERAAKGTVCGGSDKTPPIVGRSVLRGPLPIGATAKRHADIGIDAVVNSRGGLWWRNAFDRADIDLERDARALRGLKEYRVPVYQWSSRWFRRRLSHLLSHGALSASGVMAEIYGSDTPQHHSGYADGVRR